MSNVVLGMKPDTESPKTGIKNRKELAFHLTGLLSDTYLLVVKTHAYHWNVVGPMFLSLHELTEQQYEDLFEAADTLAERIRALGYPAPTSITEMASTSEISEETGNPSAEQMIERLIADHEAIVRRLREAAEIAEDLKDAVTADMLTERMAFHEKSIWMLRSILTQ